MLTADENKLLSEMLENSDEIPNENVRKWLEYGNNMAVFRANREAGTVFGNLIKTQLDDATSEAYQVIKQRLTSYSPPLNLDDYSIYSQVQLCLKGDCINKGEYWIPDFMLVAERTDIITGEKYLETIIVDSKLSKTTGWTPNQREADKLLNWTVKSVSGNNLIKGSDLGLTDQSSLIRNGKFIKLFSEEGILKTGLK